MPQTENQTKANLWFAGTCDDLFKKISLWDNAYWYGEVHSTRKWMNPVTGAVQDKPTRMAHDIPFRENELDHLVRIVSALRPSSDLLRELEEVREMWKIGKPVKGHRYMRGYWSKLILPTGLHRVITMCFYPEHVKEILSVLAEAKTGQKSAILEAAIERSKQQGKDLFEE